MKLFDRSLPGNAEVDVEERQPDSVTFTGTRDEFDAIARILAAGVTADPAISEVEPLRAAELAAKIAAAAVTENDTGFVTVTMRELLEIDSIVSAVSVLGNDPYFPSLDALGEGTIDRMAIEIQGLHDEARAMRAHSGESGWVPS